MPYVTSIERLAIEEGLEKGLQRGLEKGLQKGREQGQIAGLRESILETIEVRFGAAPQPIKKTLGEIVRVPRLRSLHRLALTCSNLAEFKRQL